MSKTQISPDSKRARAKAATRGKVLAAAKELFGEHGFGGTSIREIASRSGMSTGAVFANFVDKEDLFRAVLAEDRKAIAGALDECPMIGTVEENMASLFATIYAHYHEQRAFLGSKLGFESDILRGGYDLYQAERAELLARIHAVCEPDIMAGTLAHSEYMEEVACALHERNLRDLVHGLSVSALCDDTLPRQMELLLHPWRMEAKFGRRAAE
jgi:AcrR family transcriptional regulator